MMSEMKTPDGGPAFPIADVGVHGAFGMSLRDWFAGQALAGFSQACGWQGGDFPRMAKHAYQAADEMIAARAVLSQARA